MYKLEGNLLSVGVHDNVAWNWIITDHAISGTLTNKYLSWSAGCINEWPYTSASGLEDVIIEGELAPVPEPGSLMALGAGLISLLASRGRRR